MSETQEVNKPNGAPPPELAKPKTLVQKLAEIVSVIDHVEKSGRNEFQKYNYVKAADVAWVVRKALCERNIYLVSDVVGVRNYEIPAREGVMQAVDVQMEFSFFDGDMPETPPIVLHSYGTGTDKGDKAIYKAMTGALKYGLRHAFLIPDESDPEADTSVDKATAAQAVARKGLKDKLKSPDPKIREIAQQGLAAMQPEANTEPVVLFVIDLGDGVYEISGHSDVMENNKGLLLLYGKKTVTGGGQDRKAVVHMDAEGLNNLTFEFEKRGGKLKALKPNA